MSGNTKVVHVAWGESRADAIRDALRLLGTEAPVIALPGVLNVGPLDPLGSASRRDWARANLRDDDPDADWSEPEAPWVDIAAPDIHPVYWVCFSDAAEHASFLAFAHRMSGRPFDIVDATGFMVPDSDTVPIRSLGQLRPTEIARSDLHARRRPISAADGEAASVAWSRLQRENAPLRVMQGGRLVSAPITQFDAVLIGRAGQGWKPVIELVARVLDTADSTGSGVPYEFLFARILALGTQGALEIRGAGPGMRDYEVRRAAGL